MKRLWTFLPVVIALIGLSALIYYLQIVLFDDRRNTMFYLLQDLAFLPVQVMLVTVVLNEAFARRERAEKLRKLNMVIGVFFSEVGLDLLRLAMCFDTTATDLSPQLRFTQRWTAQDFARARRQVSAYSAAITWEQGDRTALKTLIQSRRDCIIRMLENPNLLEHESFTELLWAITHLSDELYYRQDLDAATQADAAHLAGDLARAYRLLLIEWLSYLQHLSDDYPYIFSLLVRTNPFDPKAIAEVG